MSCCRFSSKRRGALNWICNIEKAFNSVVLFCCVGIANKYEYFIIYLRVKEQKKLLKYFLKHKNWQIFLFSFSTFINLINQIIESYYIDIFIKFPFKHLSSFIIALCWIVVSVFLSRFSFFAWNVYFWWLLLISHLFYRWFLMIFCVRSLEYEKINLHFRKRNFFGLRIDKIW